MKGERKSVLWLDVFIRLLHSGLAFFVLEKKSGHLVRSIERDALGGLVVVLVLAFVTHFCIDDRCGTDPQVMLKFVDPRWYQQLPNV